MNYQWEWNWKSALIGGSMATVGGLGVFYANNQINKVGSDPRVIQFHRLETELSMPAVASIIRDADPTSQQYMELRSHAEEYLQLKDDGALQTLIKNTSTLTGPIFVCSALAVICSIFPLGMGNGIPTRRRREDSNPVSM